MSHRLDQTLPTPSWPLPLFGGHDGFAPSPSPPSGLGLAVSGILRRARAALAPPEAPPAIAAAEGLKPAGRAAAKLLAAVSKTLVQEAALINENGVLIAINPAWRTTSRRTGASPHGGLGEPYLDFCTRISPTLGRPAFRSGLEDLLAGRSSSFTHHYTAADGDPPRRRHVRIKPLFATPRPVFVVVHDDLPRAEGRSSAARACDLLEAQEEERVRIAMELHDSTCQHLAALNLSLGRLRPLVSGDKAAEVLEDMTISVGEVIKEIRVLSYLIKPAALEQHGLAGAVRTLVNGFGARTGLTASFLTRGPVDAAPPQVQHATYRIVQEALSNVYRHARAQHADVELVSEGGVLTVRISDDGQGVAALLRGEPADLESGVGLAGMRTRAAQLKGRVEISCPDCGTVVTAALPVGPGSVRLASSPAQASQPRRLRARRQGNPGSSRLSSSATLDRSSPSPLMAD
jgi:two-component system NarL family sensor kinase